MGKSKIHNDLSDTEVMEIFIQNKVQKKTIPEKVCLFPFLHILFDLNYVNV